MTNLCKSNVSTNEPKQHMRKTFSYNAVHYITTTTKYTLINGHISESMQKQCIEVKYYQNKLNINK